MERPDNTPNLSYYIHFTERVMDRVLFTSYLKLRERRKRKEVKLVRNTIYTKDTSHFEKFHVYLVNLSRYDID